MEDPGSSLFGSIVMILLLTLVNAFLAGAEMAFVSLNPAKIKDMADGGDKKAQKVQRLLQSPDLFLSAIQVGITFAGFFNSAQASQAFVGLLAPALGAFPTAATVANLIVTLILSYVSLVLGELYPKQVALQVPEQYARASAGVILFLRGAFRPFIWLLNSSVGILKKLTPIDFSKKVEKLTRQEMQALLSNSRNDGAIDMEEFNMMRGVLSLDTRLVREIMVPRVDTDMLDADDPFDKNLNIMLSQLHSRIPLYREDKDHILGIVHMKDVLINLEPLHRGDRTLEGISRPAMFIPDTMYTDELLVQFQKSKQHLAVLVDEFGGMTGIVTLEDLIEEIVGDIQDEYDTDDDAPIEMISDKEAIVLGSLPLTDVNRLFGLHVQSEGADTIAGFMIEQLGYIPKPGEEAQVALPDVTLTAVSVGNTRIETLRLTLHEPMEAQPENGEAAPAE